MSCRRWLLIPTLFALACGVVAPVSAEEPKAEAVLEIRDLELTLQPGADGELRGAVLRVAEPTEFWIGVALAEADSPVTVGQVLPDSPAAKAGLKAGDVLLSYSDDLRAYAETELKSAVQLRDAVRATNGQPIALKVRREGQDDRYVTVTPERRPADRAIVFGEAEKAGDAEKSAESAKPAIQQWLHALAQAHRPGAGPTPPAPHAVPATPFGGGGVIMHWAPAISAVGGATTDAAGPAPEDLEVTIKKRGNQPVRIKVRLGDKTWNVKDGQLDKLPPNIRSHVARLLPGSFPVVSALPGMGPVMGMGSGPGLPMPTPMLPPGAPGVAPPAPWSAPTLPAPSVLPPAAVPQLVLPPPMPPKAAPAPATPEKRATPPHVGTSPAPVPLPPPPPPPALAPPSLPRYVPGEAPVPASRDTPPGGANFELQQLKKQLQELSEKIDALMRK